MDAHAAAQAQAAQAAAAAQALGLPPPNPLAGLTHQQLDALMQTGLSHQTALSQQLGATQQSLDATLSATAASTATQNPFLMLPTPQAQIDAANAAHAQQLLEQQLLLGAAAGLNPAQLNANVQAQLELQQLIMQGQMPGQTLPGQNPAGLQGLMQSFGPAMLAGLGKEVRKK
jgi:hypothetical protein